MNDQPKAIPTNIITGFLGVGKTTTINTLLANKPEGEVWAVLVNEFGQVGIDQEMMPTEDGLHIKELAGGCICCSLGASLGQTLRALIEQAQPDRLIIEPTGIGHPEGIIDTLMGPNFKNVLDLRATVCLLDPRWLEEEGVINNEIFHDQLNLSDVVLINKCDLATPEQIEVAETGLNEMFPPKQFIGRITRGNIDPTLLDLVRNGQLKAQFPEAHAHHHDHDHDHDHSDEERENAVRRLKSYLLTEAVRKKVEISVSDEEFDTYLEERAQSAGVNVEDVKRSGRADDLRRELEEDKVFALLAEKAVVKEEKV